MSLPFTQAQFFEEDLGLFAAGLAGVWLAIDPPARARPA